MTDTDNLDRATMWVRQIRWTMFAFFGILTMARGSLMGISRVRCTDTNTFVVAVVVVSFFLRCFFLSVRWFSRSILVVVAGMMASEGGQSCVCLLMSLLFDSECWLFDLEGVVT